MRKFSFALAAAIIATTYSAASPQTATGRIVGQITERTSGRPIDGAKVSVGTDASVTSGPDGGYRLEIGSGVYDVLISADGFASLKRNQVAVTGGRNTVLNIQLE